MTTTQSPAQNGQSQNGQQQPPATVAGNGVAKTQPSQSERFTQAVEREFSGGVGPLEITSFQRKLIQNYFIKIDMVLKEAEKKRLAKTYKQDPLPFTWENVNLAKLAMDVVAYSSVGLDPAQSNHINPIPYKNNATNKYDFTFIMGYKGIELKAKKYGLDVPDDVVVELVYSNDHFKSFKKDINNKVEHYTFEVENDFDRGNIIGGFYYHCYFDAPQKNKLKTFSLKDIEKRKPDYASAEFWGGEKDKWENGQKVGKEAVEGWFDEMAYKTIYRAAYNAITIDSEKIDDHLLTVMQRERDQKDLAVLTEIKENGNKTEIGFENENNSGQQGGGQLLEEPPTQQFTPTQQQEPVHQNTSQQNQQPQAGQATMFNQDNVNGNTNGKKSGAPF